MDHGSFENAAILSLSPHQYITTKKFQGDKGHRVYKKHSNTVRHMGNDEKNEWREEKLPVLHNNDIANHLRLTVQKNYLYERDSVVTVADRRAKRSFHF